MKRRKTLKNKIRSKKEALQLILQIFKESLETTMNYSQHTGKHRGNG